MSKIAFDRLSFLVVDDNSHMRRLVRSLLHGFGSRQVYEAEDGASGLEAVETYGPDIMITDWAMPIFDGLELVQMIRNPDSCKNAYIPIIMLTGHSEKHRVIQARDVGVTEFLCKPISAKALYDRIYAIVMNPRPFIRTKNYFGPDRRRDANANYAGPERRSIDVQAITPKKIAGDKAEPAPAKDSGQWEIGEEEPKTAAAVQEGEADGKGMSVDDIDSLFANEGEADGGKDMSSDDIDSLFENA